MKPDLFMFLTMSWILALCYTIILILRTNNYTIKHVFFTSASTSLGMLQCTLLMCLSPWMPLLALIGFVLGFIMMTCELCQYNCKEAAWIFPSIGAYYCAFAVAAMLPYFK